MRIEFDIDTTKLNQVWRISDFCHQYKLDDKEEVRLSALLGEFATAAELLMNSERRPRFR